MRKLNKNFKGSKLTVEAMANSCLNGCSCNRPKCSCSSSMNQNVSESNRQYNSLLSTYRNAAY